MTPLGWLGRKTSTQTNKLSTDITTEWLNDFYFFHKHILALNHDNNKTAMKKREGLDDKMI